MIVYRCDEHGQVGECEILLRADDFRAFALEASHEEMARFWPTKKRRAEARHTV